MSFLIKLINRCRGVVPMLLDKSVPLWKRLVLLAGIVYVLLPVDMVPIVFPVVGFMDDVIVLTAIYYFLGPDLDAHAPGMGNANRSKKYRYKSGDYQEVNFSVNEDPDEKSDDNSNHQ